MAPHTHSLCTISLCLACNSAQTELVQLEVAGRSSRFNISVRCILHRHPPCTRSELENKWLACDTSGQMCAASTDFQQQPLTMEGFFSCQECGLQFFASKKMQNLVLINFFCKQKKSAKNISLELKIACVLTRTSLYHRLRSHVCDYVALPFLLFPRHLFSHGRRKILSYFCTNVFVRSVRGRTCRACTTTQKQQLLIYVTRSAACFIFLPPSLAARLDTSTFSRFLHVGST